MAREIKVGDVLDYDSGIGPGKSSIVVKRVDTESGIFWDQNDEMWAFWGEERGLYTHQNQEGTTASCVVSGFDSVPCLQWVYIAGPMRGRKWFNFPAFDKAWADLTARGYEVVSPADLDRESGFDPCDLPEDSDWNDIDSFGFSLHDAIKRDTEAIQKCDCIYMLQGWEDSSGARAEKALAEWLFLEVMYESEPVIIGETTTNAAGGKQSRLDARFDCVPPSALRLLAQCCGFGAKKYGRGNWKLIPLDDHVAHAMNHLNEWNRGDTSEPHLVNALTRVSMALAQAVETGVQGEDYAHPDMVK